MKLKIIYLQLPEYGNIRKLQVYYRLLRRHRVVSKLVPSLQHPKGLKVKNRMYYDIFILLGPNSLSVKCVLRFSSEFNETW